MVTSSDHNSLTFWPNAKSEEWTVEVYAGCGAVADKKFGVITERMECCSIVFITSPEFVALIHMNPNESLPWKNPQRTGRRIADSLKEFGVDLKTCKAVIVGNDLYDEEYTNEQNENWLELEQILADCGISKVVISNKLPLSCTAVYYDPKVSGRLFAMGRKTVKVPHGNSFAGDMDGSKLGLFHISLEDENFGNLKHVLDKET